MLYGRQSFNLPKNASSYPNISRAETNKTFSISNSSNLTNKTVIYGYTDEIVEDFNFDEFGTPLIPDRT